MSTDIRPFLETCRPGFGPRSAPCCECFCLRFAHTKPSTLVRIGNQGHAPCDQISDPQLTWNTLLPWSATTSLRFALLVSRAFLPETLHTSSSSSRIHVSICLL